MKQNTVADLPSLNITRYERLFDIYEDKNNIYYYNILKTINFDQSNMSPDIYTIYTTTAGDSYPLISYKKYQTIDLWWLICSFNNISDPTKLPEPGTQLKVLGVELINNILNNIS